LPQKLPSVLYSGRALASIFIAGPVFGRAAAGIKLKNPVKCFKAGETAEAGNIRDRYIRFNKVFFRPADPDFGKVCVVRFAGLFFEKTGKVEFVQRRGFRGVVQGNAAITGIGLDKGKYPFQGPVVGTALVRRLRQRLIAGHLPQENKGHFIKIGLYCQTEALFPAVVFLSDFQYQFLKPAVNRIGFVRGDIGFSAENEFPYHQVPHFDQAVFKKFGGHPDDTGTNIRASVKKPMYYPRINNKNIAGNGFPGLPAYKNTDLPFEDIHYLYKAMPMTGKSFERVVP
jgi:hypothetical protein